MFVGFGHGERADFDDGGLDAGRMFGVGLGVVWMSGLVGR